MAFPGDVAHSIHAYLDERGASCPACALCEPRSALPAACQHLPLSETPFAAARLERAERLPQGFSKTAPPSGSVGVHSRGLAPASARSLPSAVLVPPSPFLPASTVFSTNGIAGLLRPASDHGVHRVSAHRRRMPASSPRFLSDACPPEPFPSEKRTSRHRKVMPPCRSPATPARLRGLDPLGNPLRRILVAESRRPMLSWASLPGAPPDRVHQRVRPRTGNAEGAPRARASASRSGG